MGSNPYNLIGNPLEDSVIKQVVTRASLQGVAEGQSEASIIFKSRKNAFAKLTSFVEVKDDKLATALGGAPGVELAKNWTLFNGVNVGNGTKQSILGTNGYGQGGLQELGVRPMPGIVSVNVTPAGTAGSVRIAKVVFRCHNLNQLDIMDVLYMRLGFDMLLEWGHTTYANNNGGIQIGEDPIDIFGNDYNKEELFIEINKRKKRSFGNYDAMLGRVSNYVWSLTTGGSYECTLTLTGIGAIIESLKINGSDGTPDVTGIPVVQQQKQGEEPAKNTSNVSTQQTLANNFNSSLSAALLLWKSQALLGKSFTDFNEYVGFAMDAGLGLWRRPSDGFKYGYNSAYMEGRTEGVNQIVFEKIATYYYPDFEVVSNNEVLTSELIYIPLGLLLAYLNSNCTLYNTGKGEKTPLLYIDFHPDTNFCFTLPAQCSVDPTVCLLDYKADTKTIEDFYKVRLQDSVSKITAPLFGPDANAIATDMDGKKLTMGSFIDETVTDHTRGKIMNILVSIDYILLTLQNMSVSDKDGAVYLSAFLDNILSGITKATGNINKFKVGYDDDSNVMRIYDEQLVNSGANTEYPTLPIYGLGSVVQSLTFSTDVSNKLASAIAITAGAGERNPIPAGKDVSAFAALNSRLENRIMPFKTVTPSGPEVSTSKPENLLPLANSLNQHMINIYSSKRFNVADIQNVSNFYSEACNALKSNTKQAANGDFTVESDSVTARGILPLKIEFTMDGISTMRLREGFVVPADRLPSQYKNGSVVQVGFVISGVTHDIANNKWITKVTAQMVNIPKQNTLTSGYSISQKARSLAGSAAGARPAGSVKIVATPPISVSKLGFGLPLNPPFTISSFLGRSGSKKKGVSGNASGHDGYDMIGANGGNKNIELSSKVGGKGTNGDIIYAVQDGVVELRNDPNGYGPYILITHNIKGEKFTSLYGHMPLGGIQVKSGQQVTRGTSLGYLGSEGRSTGFHLHFELYKGGFKGVIADPGDYLPLFASDGGPVPGDLALAGTRYGEGSPKTNTPMTNPNTFT